MRNVAILILLNALNPSNNSSLALTGNLLKYAKFFIKKLLIKTEFTS